MKIIGHLKSVLATNESLDPRYVQLFHCEAELRDDSSLSVLNIAKTCVCAISLRHKFVAKVYEDISVKTTSTLSTSAINYTIDDINNNTNISLFSIK